MPWWKFWSDEEEGDTGPRDHFEQGREYAEQEKYRRALASFRHALHETSVQSERVEALEEIAMAYTQLKWHDEAIKSYREALEIDPRSPGSHYGLAFRYEDRDQYEAARRHLEAFLENPPDWPDAEQHVRHARRTLQELRQRQKESGSESEAPADAPAEPSPREETDRG